jgi:hypothetical protein
MFPVATLLYTLHYTEVQHSPSTIVLSTASTYLWVDQMESVVLSIASTYWWVAQMDGNRSSIYSVYLLEGGL